MRSSRAIITGNGPNTVDQRQIQGLDPSIRHAPSLLRCNACTIAPPRASPSSAATTSSGAAAPPSHSSTQPQSRKPSSSSLPPMAMANRCTSLDSTWSHLPAPAPALWPCTAWFSPAAAAFENDALASALAHASASPPSPTPSSSTTTTTTSSASELYDAPAHAQPVTCSPAPAGRPQAPQCTGRVSKRKPRASRRPPTTYISADPADFRRMVQEITGFGVPGADHASAATGAAPRRAPDPLAFVLPTLDTSACFMVDRAPWPPQQQRSEGKTSGGAPTAMDPGADGSSLRLMQELEAMMSAPAAVSAFPTLESWGMI